MDEVWSFETLTRGCPCCHFVSSKLWWPEARGFMFETSIDNGCFVDLFCWMKPLRLKNILLFGAAKLQIRVKSPQVFSSAKISELGHKFRLNWVRPKFQAEEFVVIRWHLTANFTSKNKMRRCGKLSSKSAMFSMESLDWFLLFGGAKRHRSIWKVENVHHWFLPGSSSSTCMGVMSFLRFLPGMEWKTL